MGREAHSPVSGDGSTQFWELTQPVEHLRGMAQKPLDDLTLIRMCRGGSTDAFGVLVRRYQEKLYPTVHRLVGSADDAEDVLQDAFVRAFERIASFHGDSSFYTWIYRIAVNLAVQHCRRRRVRKAFRFGSDPPDASRRKAIDPGIDCDPSLSIERRERELAVCRALDELCPEHRAIVVLKDYDGRRYEEIAEILKIPIGTVRSRLHRARGELRRLLAPLVESESTVSRASALST